MQRAEAVEADDRVEVVDDAGQPLRRPHVVAGGEQVAGVEADAEALVAAGQLDQRRELLERAAERAAGAGGVLEVQRARLGLRERLGDRLAAARSSAASTGALQRRAGVQHHAVRRRAPRPPAAPRSAR